MPCQEDGLGSVAPDHMFDYSPPLGVLEEVWLATSESHWASGEAQASEFQRIIRLNKKNEKNTSSTPSAAHHSPLKKNNFLHALRFESFKLCIVGCIFDLASEEHEKLIAIYRVSCG